MKTNKYILYAMLLPVLMLASSCSRESLPGAESDPVLLISPVAQDGQESILRTRALTDDDLKDDKYQENVINRLDVFFFNGNALAKAYHKDKESLTPETHAGITGYPLSKDFTQDGLQKGVQYTVYVIANAASDAIKTGTGISAPADLEALTLEDANIYKRQKNDTEDITYTKEKSFLMNAKINWTIPTVATQLVGDAMINLTRTAVKFVIDISLSDEFKDRLEKAGLQYGDPSWKYQHFNIQSYEVLGSQTEAVKELIDSPSGGWAYLAAEALEDDTYQIVTYAYPQAWTDGTAMDEVPAILLSFAASGNFHYYYIPLCQSSLGATASNHLYRVKAVINSFGSSEAVTSNDVDLTYEVKGWDEGTDKIATVNAQLTEYLMVTPTTYVFKGGSTSSALTTQVKYYASDKVTLSGLSGFYIDKNGTKVTVNSGNSTYTVSSPSATETSGALDINSIVPTNGTYREFQFTLTCGTKSQVVKVRHYPLDFITAESGAYSTYDDPLWVSPGQSGSYASSQSYNNNFYFVAGTAGSFNAKEYYNKGFWNIGLDGNRTNQSEVSHLTNNRMYVLQVTSSNDTYTIGRPALQSNTTSIYGATQESTWGGSYINYTNTVVRTGVNYYTSSDNVLSPAFMLGSQLGANGGFPTAESAAIHCALYKEVVNGTEYTGWRLPTKQEVQYMIDNQNSYGDVMDEVLGGHYYWALDGTKAEYADGDYPNNTYTRCVRDLSADELKEINKFE